MAGFYIPFEPIKMEFHIITVSGLYPLSIFGTEHNFLQTNSFSIDVCCVEIETAVSVRSNAVGASTSVSLEIGTEPFSGVLPYFWNTTRWTVSRNLVILCSTIVRTHVERKLLTTTAFP
jgi:hypothetical protein